MLTDSGTVGLGLALQQQAFRLLLSWCLSLFESLGQKHVKYMFQWKAVFLTVLFSLPQEKTTPELYYLSVLLSVSSLVSTGKQKTSQVTYLCQRLIISPSREGTVQLGLSHCKQKSKKLRSQKSTRKAERDVKSHPSHLIPLHWMQSHSSPYSAFLRPGAALVGQCDLCKTRS